MRLSTDEIKNEIVKFVIDVQGCKVSEMIPRLSKEAITSCDNLPSLLDDMISSGELAAVAYSVPSIPYREKLFLLPPGTEFHRTSNEFTELSIESTTDSE
jgi:hypothetical protein